jgi:hypothetical protein
MMHREVSPCRQHFLVPPGAASPFYRFACVPDLNFKI